MAMRSVLRRNLTGATRWYTNGKGRVSIDNRRYAENLNIQNMERQNSDKRKKEKAEREHQEKLKKEEAEKEKEDADKKSEGSHLG